MYKKKKQKNKKQKNFFGKYTLFSEYNIRWKWFFNKFA